MNSARQTFGVTKMYKNKKINPGSTQNVELLGEKFI
jgi:hypothetical protein